MPASSSSDPRIRLHRLAWALFAVTLAVRLFVISRLTASPYFTPDGGDTKFYNDWALRILHGQWTDGHAFYGLPGYAFLMAGIYKIGGYNPFYLTTLQAIAEGFTAYFIFRIAVSVFQKTDDSPRGIIVGILAALGYAFFVPAQAFSVILMPTSLLVCLFWWVVNWAISGRRTLPIVAAIGLATGLMSLMVATIFFTIPLVVFALYGKNLRASALGWVVYFAAILFGASPAILHNRLIAHDPVMLSAHGGLNFFMGNNAAANGYPVIPAGLRAGQVEMLKDSITIAEAHLKKAPSDLIPRSAVSQFWAGRAREYIRSHPADWMRLEWQKIKNFWNALQYDDLSMIAELSEGGILTPGIYFGLIASLGLAGMVVAAVLFPRSRWVAAAVLLHMASLLTVFVTERYRLAAAPGLLIFSSFLAVTLWEKLATARWWTALSLGGITLATTAFVTQPAPVANPRGLDDFNIGLHALALGDLTRAEEKLQYAWRSSPNKDEINFALGNLYLTKNEPQRAKFFYQHTVELNPRHDGALNNLGVIAMKQKMPAVAARFFKKSLESEPDDAKTNFQLAQALRESGDRVGARLALDHALAILPHEKAFLDLKQELEQTTPPN